MENGQKLKNLRVQIGLSQSKLADILDCYPHQICLWESGKVELSANRLRYFMDILISAHVISA